MTHAKLAKLWDTQLRNEGALVVPIVGGAMQRPGLPDRWVCHRRWCGWIEYKTGRVADSQIAVMREIWQHGGVALVVRPRTIESPNGEILAQYEKMQGVVDLLNQATGKICKNDPGYF